MRKVATKILGAWLLQPKVFVDERGFFLESWSRETFRSVGLDFDFVQDNQSRSSRHVLRGLHYQVDPSAQGKLVWVSHGTVFDVIVDLRQRSPTFGFWEGYTLGHEAQDRLYVPPGCAHGFLVMSEFADFHYKVTAPYNPKAERSLRWDDPSLAIAWPLENRRQPLISSKDNSAQAFLECEKYV